jgi:hypothetical protein
MNTSRFCARVIPTPSSRQKTKEAGWSMDK